MQLATDPWHGRTIVPIKSMNSCFGRLISQPGNWSLIIDLEYETERQSTILAARAADTKEEVDKLKGYRFIGMLNSSELFLEAGYEFKEDSYADGPQGVARRENHYAQLCRAEDKKWCEKAKNCTDILWLEKQWRQYDEWYPKLQEQWKQHDEWYKDFGGPPLPDSYSDCVHYTKDNDDDNIESASKATEQAFSYPSLEDIDDDDDGTRPNTLPVTPVPPHVGSTPASPFTPSLDLTDPNTAEAPPTDEGPRPQTDGLQYNTWQKDNQRGKDDDPKPNLTHSNIAEAPPKPEGPRPQKDGLLYKTRPVGRKRCKEGPDGQNTGTAQEQEGLQRMAEEGAAGRAMEDNPGKSTKVQAGQGRGDGGLARRDARA